MSKILVIDDDAAVRRTIVRVRRRDGHELISASDGQRGVELFQSENPELVITDIIMPQKNGIQTIREILTMDPEARIIVTSGSGRFSSTDNLAMALKLGARELIAKPFDLSTLREAATRSLAAT